MQSADGESPPGELPSRMEAAAPECSRSSDLASQDRPPFPALAGFAELLRTLKDSEIRTTLSVTSSIVPKATKTWIVSANPAHPQPLLQDKCRALAPY